MDQINTAELAIASARYYNNTNLFCYVARQMVTDLELFDAKEFCKLLNDYYPDPAAVQHWVINHFMSGTMSDTACVHFVNAFYPKIADKPRQTDFSKDYYSNPSMYRSAFDSIISNPRLFDKLPQLPDVSQILRHCQDMKVHTFMYYIHEYNRIRPEIIADRMKLIEKMPPDGYSGKWIART